MDQASEIDSVMENIQSKFQAPPAIVREQDNDYEWEQSIEVKLNNLGKVVIGLGVATAVITILSVLQGRIVVKLVKGQGAIIEYINSSVAANNTPATVDYVAPTGRVSEPDEPVDTSLLEDLKAAENHNKDKDEWS